MGNEKWDCCFVQKDVSSCKFDTSWKQKTKDFLMFSKGIKKETMTWKYLILIPDEFGDLISILFTAYFFEGK